jgi:iron complex outermembrane receptor protein
MGGFAMKNQNTVLMFAFVCLLGAPLSVPRVNAQATAVLEEVVVSARKREESLLDIPLTITAFSSSDIERLNLRELPDIVDFSPGFYYGENSVGRGGRFNRRLIFRGMNPRTDRQTRQGATVFIDGAPILGSEIGSTENYERIEVIKGPQSAYFGRSTFSGAINVVTKTPGNEWSGKISAEAGRFGMSDFRGNLEGPLVQDKLSFRLTGNRYDTGGEYANAADPTQRLGIESTTDFALSLYATPTDRLRAKLRVHYWRDEDGPSIGLSVRRADHPELFNCAPGGLAAGGQWICGEVPYLGVQEVGMDTALTPELRNLFFSQAMTAAFIFDRVPYGSGLERNAHELSLNVDYEFANGMTFTSISAAHQNEYASFEDFDRRPTAGLGGADTYNLTLTGNKDFSQEFRLSSSDDQRLRWVVGVSYTRLEGLLQGFSKFGPVVPNPNQAVNTFDPETTAVFGAVGWDINDQFTLSVEARSQQDKVKEGIRGGAQLSETFDSFTPRIILDYKPNADTTYYATFAQGTNPGQFNAGLVNRTADELAQIAAAGGGGVRVGEEELTNYELGVKSRFWGGRAQVSAAAYFANWDSIVAPELIEIINASNQPEIIQVNATGGQADMSGLELEGTLLVTDQLTLEATFALTKSDIKDFESPDALRLLGFRTIDGLGSSFSRYPETSGTLSGTYADQLTAEYDWFLRGDVIYRGDTWLSNANVSKSGAYTLLNLRVGVESESWRIELYGTNLSDETGFSNLQLFTDLSGQTGPSSQGNAMINGGLIPRRSFGIRASFEF